MSAVLSICVLTLKIIHLNAVPNIIFILMDDLGWNDVSYNGGQFPTPNIDNLKSHSIELTKHYIHLMCSPSRTQILTGRYAMRQGLGRMVPWDYTEIGGIPLGQPTIANWLKITQNYHTFAIGKWHCGYAYEGLLPTFKGFDHFFGFYQGAIRYNTLQYVDIEFGNTIHYDFWEDDKPYSNVEQILSEFAANNKTVYSMNLYRDKIIKYIETETSEKNKNPFYMYLALQTFHTPLPSIDEYTMSCEKILGDATENNIHGNQGLGYLYRYCENTIATDNIIGDIINSLKINNIWDNTLVIFTSDNGAELTITGCNYPLRGTKGVEFDGNTRVIALIGGGYIPNKYYGTSRDTLFSSLDWTPTLLHFAGGLEKINKIDYTWDGYDQYDLIMNNIDTVNRDHIVFNIAKTDLESATIVFKYGNNQNLHKYISGDEQSIDTWLYTRIDGWCYPDENNIFDILEIDKENITLAQAVNQKYLFDITNDPAEKVNLLKLETDTNEIVEYAKSILYNYVIHPLYAEHFEFLWDRNPEGDPMLFDDGFVHPFLNENNYLLHLEKGINELNKNEIKISKELKTLYFHKWTPPVYAIKKPLNTWYIYTIIGIVIVALIVIVIISIARWRHLRSFYKDGYEPIANPARNNMDKNALKHDEVQELLNKNSNSTSNSNSDSESDNNTELIDNNSNDRAEYTHVDSNSKNVNVKTPLISVQN
eukprot:497155_1